MIQKRWAWTKALRHPTEDRVVWVRDDEKAVENFSEAYFDGLVIRWKSNDSVPPLDCMEQWADLGLLSDAQFAASDLTREKETREAIQAYREYREQHGYSAEEVAEAHAELGADVVDVLTGKRIA